MGVIYCRVVLTEEQTDYFIVHLGGFLLDLTIGFFLFFDATRLFGLFFCTMFHLMNSMMFHIGKQTLGFRLIIISAC